MARAGHRARRVADDDAGGRDGRLGEQPDLLGARRRCLPVPCCPDDDRGHGDHAERKEDERRELDRERQAPEPLVARRPASAGSGARSGIVAEAAHRVEAGLVEELDELDRRTRLKVGVSAISRPDVARLVVEVVAVEEEEAALAGRGVDRGGRRDERDGADARWTGAAASARTAVER
jgi:hypothetical protein